MKDALSKLFGFLGKLLAILIIIAILLDGINGVFQFMPAIWTTVMHYIKTYGLLVLTGVITLSFAVKRNLIIAIIFVLVIVAAFAFNLAGNIISGWIS